ncbi:MAG: hypothetical protein EOO46_10795 [Flavobacterium sp.]|nr:MAG: hypothetical protein EOO46_10795 [Flavobacterium sp.]
MWLRLGLVAALAAFSISSYKINAKIDSVAQTYTELRSTINQFKDTNTDFYIAATGTKRDPIPTVLQSKLENIKQITQSSSEAVMGTMPVSKVFYLSPAGRRSSINVLILGKSQVFDFFDGNASIQNFSILGLDSNFSMRFSPSVATLDMTVRDYKGNAVARIVKSRLENIAIVNVVSAPSLIEISDSAGNFIVGFYKTAENEMLCQGYFYTSEGIVVSGLSGAATLPKNVSFKELENTMIAAGVQGVFIQTPKSTQVYQPGA